MEELEPPIEHVHEQIHHHAQHSGERWISLVALGTAILAGCAAFSSLLAGHHANEAMIDQIQASDKWSHYQAKSIKAAVLAAKIELLQALGKTVEEKDLHKAADYTKDQEELRREAEERQHASEKHLHVHSIFARSVTLHQVAIAVAAIAVLTKRRKVFALSMLFGAAGVAFMIQALLGS